MVSLLPLLILGQGSPHEVQQRQFLEQKYQALNHSIKNLDLSSVHDWIANNASPDFFLHPSGASMLSASETVQMLKGQFLILKSVKASTMKLGNLSLHPDRMSCSVKSHLDAMTKDKRHLISDSLAVNTWKLIRNKWKIASMVTTRQQSTVNGKPLPPIR